MVFVGGFVFVFCCYFVLFCGYSEGGGWSFSILNERKHVLFLKPALLCTFLKLKAKLICWH